MACECVCYTGYVIIHNIYDFRYMCVCVLGFQLSLPIFLLTLFFCVVVVLLPATSAVKSSTNDGHIPSFLKKSPCCPFLFFFSCLNDHSRRQRLYSYVYIFSTAASIIKKVYSQCQWVWRRKQQAAPHLKKRGTPKRNEGRTVYRQKRATKNNSWWLYIEM